MKKSLKMILVIIGVLVVAAGVIVGIVLIKHNKSYITKDDALQIALADAGVKYSELIDSEVDFEKNKYSAWYEIEFETHKTEYEYHIDAVTGEILSSYTEPND